MKRTISFVLTLMLTLLMCVPSTASFDRSYTAPKGTTEIDGEAESLWDYAEWTTVDVVHDASDDGSAELKIKLLWDENNLYFLAEVYDDDINELNDIVEIYIDEKMDRASSFGEDDSHTRFMLADGGVVQDSGANCRNSAPCKVSDQGDDIYLMEGAIAWSQKDHKEGGILGVEFMYNEAGDGVDFIEAYRWNADTASGDPQPWQNTEAFGTLVLGAAPVIETEAPATEAPVTETPAAEATAAPATADMGIVAAVAVMALAAGSVIAGKKK